MCVKEPFAIQVIRQRFIGQNFSQTIANGENGLFAAQMEISGLAYLRWQQYDNDDAFGAP